MAALIGIGTVVATSVGALLGVGLPGRSPLKHELQRQLHGTWSADLIERIEPTVRAAASERRSQHLRRLPELRRTEIVDGTPEIGVIEDVEQIRSRLKSKPLPKFELPP